MLSIRKCMWINSNSEEGRLQDKEHIRDKEDHIQSFQFIKKKCGTDWTVFSPKYICWSPNCPPSTHSDCIRDRAYREGKWKWKSLSPVWLFAIPWTLFSPWNSPGQNTGVGSLSLLQGMFPTQGLHPDVPPGRRILYQLSHQGSPGILQGLAYPFSSGASQPRNWTRVSCIEVASLPTELSGKLSIGK